MRSVSTTFLSLLPIVGQLTGCLSNANKDCDQNYIVCHGQGGASGVTTASGPGGGGAGGSATGCDPSLEKNAVGNGCGVFVSSSQGDDAMGDGSKEKPFKTIGKAASAKKAIYLCGESFSESVTLPSGIALYGALACASDWHYDASKKTALTADADKIPLTVTKGDGESQIADLAITSKDATKPGGSSIAVLAVEAKATLKRVELTAGKGAAGADAPADVADPANDGADGKSPLEAGCQNKGIIGGGGGQKICQGNVDVSGGDGGSGSNGPSGVPGGNGNPYPSGDPANGQGGKAQDANSSCKAGNDGVSGPPGKAGDGATGIGMLTDKGYAGVVGGTGKAAGTPGQGGGGGGGGSKNGCADMTSYGPSGGGGGSGGCGGKPGTGGAPGGASLALVSISSALMLSDAKLTAPDGGAGGQGSTGQAGGKGHSGGFAAMGGKPSGTCNGGSGGNGGQGGAGGGGLGGHSIGVAYTGMAPAMMTNVTITVGKAGTGGAGGDGGAGNQGGKGDDGVSEKVKGFDGK